VSQAPRNTSRKALKSEFHGSRVSADRNALDDRSDRSRTIVIMKEDKS
jgi:hypothetical protein